MRDIIFGVVGIIIMLSGSILMARKRIWYLYSHYLVILAFFFSLQFILSYIPLPSINNNNYIRFGFLTLPVTDMLLTRKILSLGGREANPIAVLLMKYIKPTPTFILFFLCMFGLVYFLWKEANSFTLYSLILLYGYVIYNNVKVLRRRMKK